MGNSVGVKSNGVRHDAQVATSNGKDKAWLNSLDNTLAKNQSRENLMKLLASDIYCAECFEILQNLESLRQADPGQVEKLAEVVSANFQRATEQTQTTNPSHRALGELLRKSNHSSVLSMILLMSRKTNNGIQNDFAFTSTGAEQQQVRSAETVVGAGSPIQQASQQQQPNQPKQPKHASIAASAKPFHEQLIEEKQTSKLILSEAAHKLDDREKNELLAANSWLAELLVAVESLPVCVSLSSARQAGFPLIYVNAFFEKTTGYSREEIVGQNCRFLQAGRSERESIEKLSTALRSASPVKVSITNFRKDGMPFRNLLSMKPIFDNAGEYRYVVGVQFDVTQSDSTPAKLKLANELMKLLPDVISTTTAAS